MGWSFKKLLSKNPVSTNYDSYNHEAAAITAHPESRGLRCEVTSSVLPWMQLTAIRTATSPHTQFFSTIAFPGSVFQMCFDTGRNYQVRSTVVRGPISARIHSIVSAQREVYAKIESFYNSRFFNVGLKLITPTVHATNLICIFNCWRAFGRACLGVELIGMGGDVGLSIASRLEQDDAVYCLGLQRLNMLVASAYRRLRSGAEVGAEVHRSSTYASCAAGLRLKTFRTELRCTVDQALRVGYEWNEKLTEKITVNFTGTYDEEGLNYGIGMFYEG